MSITDRRRSLFELLASPGTRNGFFASVADDVEWTVMGTHPLAGTYRDKRSFLDATFGRLDRLRQGGMQIEILALYEAGDVVVAEMTARATAIDGGSFDHAYVWVCRFEGEVIVEARAYLDSALVAGMIDRVEPMAAALASDQPESVIQTGPRHEHERVYERAADAAEAADRPLEPKWRPHRLARADEPGELPQPEEPHHALNTPVGDVDPTADSDPYREPSEDDSDQWASGTRGEGQGSEDG
jgi:hypothetical protein